MNTTKEKIDILRNKIKKHETSIKMIRAKIEYFQNICPHPKDKVKTWNSSDYKGGSDSHWECEECGKYKVT